MMSICNRSRRLTLTAPMRIRPWTIFRCWLTTRIRNPIQLAQQPAGNQGIFDAQTNPDVFDGDMNRLGVGQSLVLPAFATSAPVKTATPAGAAMVPLTETSNVEPVVAGQSQKANSVRFAKTAKPAAADKAVTPDPEDIIGQVVISIGDMQADNRGTQRDLERRSPILKGDTIAVIGAGLLGIETALWLAQKGKNIILVEAAEHGGKAAKKKPETR